MAKAVAWWVICASVSLNSYASTGCDMLGMAEPGIIKSYARFYMEVLEANPTLQDAKNTVFWHREIANSTTLKEAEKKLSPKELDTLSRAGCQPWQGAAFNLNMDTAIMGSAYRIFSESSTKEEAYLKLSRLAQVKKIIHIPADLRATD